MKLPKISYIFLIMTWLKIKEVANYLQLSERTVYKLVREGSLPAARIGGVYRFDSEEIDIWLRTKKSRAKRVRPLKIQGEEVAWAKISKEPDELKKRLLFIGLLTEKLSHHSSKPVIVGGTAVEFYTAGGYATADIDIAYPSELIDEVKDKLNLIAEGRYWYNEELGIVLEAPIAFVDAVAKEHLTKVKIDDLTVYLLGVEDLIIDRLNAFVHWQSTDDGNWAKELMAIQAEEINWFYLKDTAVDNKVDKALMKMADELNLRDKLSNASN